MVIEADVNFDGKNDILICLGHFGAQMALAYKCFPDGEFVMTERLTEEPAESENLWTWRDEILVDNEWQTREYFTEEYFDSETLYNKFYGSDSYWKLQDEWWNTLFNGGKMSDFSIYGD